MIPLRIAAIISNVLFMGYGLMAKALPTFFMYAVLLPINCFRLYQIQQLVKRVKIASQGDLDMEWLKPFMTKKQLQRRRRAVPQGRCRERDVLHRHRQIPGQGDSASNCRPAGSWASSAFSRPTTNAPPPSNASRTDRCCSSSTTRSANCISRIRISDFIFLKLTSERLLQNIARLEGEVDTYKARVQALEAAEASRTT